MCVDVGASLLDSQHRLTLAGLRIATNDVLVDMDSRRSWHDPLLTLRLV